MSVSMWMSVRPLPRAGAALFCLALAGCGLLDPDEELRPAVILAPGQPVLLQAPDTVFSAVPFSVSVSTFGAGCTNKGTTKVEIEGRTATLVPMDRHLITSDACAAFLAEFTHEVQVVFEGEGPAVVAVRGLELRSDTLVVHQRAVHVR